MLIGSADSRVGSETESGSRGCQDPHLAHVAPQHLYANTPTYSTRLEQHYTCSMKALQHLHSKQLQLRQGDVAWQQEVSSTTIDQSDWMEYRMLDDLLAETYPVEQLSDASHSTSPFEAAPAATAYFTGAVDAQTGTACTATPDLSKYGRQLPDSCSPLLQALCLQQQQQQGSSAVAPFADVYCHGRPTALLQSQLCVAEQQNLQKQQQRDALYSAADRVGNSSHPWKPQDESTSANFVQLYSSQQSLQQQHWAAAEDAAAGIAAEAVAAAASLIVKPAAQPMARATTPPLSSSRTAAAAAAAAGITLETAHDVLPFGTSFGTVLMRDNVAHQQLAAGIDAAAHTAYLGNPAALTTTAIAAMADEQTAVARGGCHGRHTQSLAVPLQAAAYADNAAAAAKPAAAALTVQIPDFQLPVVPDSASPAAGFASAVPISKSSARKPSMASPSKGTSPGTRNKSSPGSPVGKSPSKIAKKERNSHYQRVCRERQQKELMDLKTQVANLTSQNTENRERVQSLLRSQSQLLDRLRDLTVKWQATISSNDALRRENAEFQQHIMAYQQRMLRHSL